MLVRALLLLLAGLAAKDANAAKMYSIFSAYLGDECGGTPYLVTIADGANCTASSCAAFNTFDSRLVNANMATSECSTDYLQTVRDKFGSSPYLVQLLHGDDDCSELTVGFGYPATGSCVGAYNESDSLYVIASLNDNGSALFQQFLGRTCFSDQLYLTESIDKEMIANHSCDGSGFQWYSSNDVGHASGGDVTSGGGSENGLSDGSIMGIALGAAAVLLVAILVYTRRLKRLRSVE
ncbi:hypothetical protein PHYPSEUDO_003953 [Phytophthora pseudosyringae]|uniref:TKL protein kinase n=1 Tax=Phytophthora pseudosyringae TaxID=221518 RepID=A0A8T1VQF5_9STRA|nr:hypothetical protein PHYPSEUDO_003953 [Phytophthora pseudosyringae]